MAMRSIIVDGVPWTAWEVIPGTDPTLNPALLRDDLRRGWLCFESPTEKRRISPTPVGWEGWSDDRLTLAIKAARVVGRAAARH